MAEAGKWRGRRRSAPALEAVMSMTTKRARRWLVPYQAHRRGKRGPARGFRAFTHCHSARSFPPESLIRARFGKEAGMLQRLAVLGLALLLAKRKAKVMLTRSPPKQARAWP